MFIELTVALVINCAPAHRPPIPSPRCEGADQVRRDHDLREIGRWSNAPMCNRATCEGADYVRRDSRGHQMARWVMAPSCTRARCEGGDFVRRDLRGVELERWANAPAPHCPARMIPAPQPWTFGLTARR